MTNIILFRAQPFHNGHLNMIKKAFEDSKRDNNRLYVFVGSADKSGTKRNPLPVDVRLDLIKNSLKDEIKDNFVFNPNTNVIPLNDLSDEANNTHYWGYYLFDKIKEVVKDEYWTMYYSDRPDIMLSWFDDNLREHISFKFLPRHCAINATSVRSHILNDVDILLQIEVPKYVYNNKQMIKEYLEKAI